MELKRVKEQAIAELQKLEKEKKETPNSKRSDNWKSWAFCVEMNSKRMIEIVEITERMTEEEKVQIRETPVYQDDIRFLKPIKEKYELSWNELKMLIRSDI